MKILHINTYSEYGGAAIAAKRHCEAMRRAGLESKMLSLVGKENEYTQIVLKNSYDVKKWKWMVAYTQKASRIIIKKFAWHWTFLHYDISRYNIVNEADIIYVHWINDFLNMDDIKGLLKQGKTIVLFLHDMWPITGGCHYSLDCERYQSGCYNCPQMKSMKFLAVKQLKKRINKIKGYSKLHIVAPSRWLFNCISNSLVANKTSASISCIPNVIDVAKFIPMKKSESKEKLSLDSKRKYILFCAMDSANPYKGFKYLVDALSILENEEYEYIVMGKCDREDFPQLIRPKLHIMGFISKTEVLVDIYNASDILLITSVAENFPNVVLEAMACGVPVVGFDTGGIKDQVVHKETGILVKNFNSQGIAEGAKWILNNPTYSKISLAAREYVVNNYSFEKILDIHKDILNKN